MTESRSCEVHFHPGAQQSGLEHPRLPAGCALAFLAVCAATVPAYASVNEEGPAPVKCGPFKYSPRANRKSKRDRNPRR